MAMDIDALQLDRRPAWGAGPTSPAAPWPEAEGVTVHWLGADWTPGPHTRCLEKVAQIRDEHVADPDEDWVDIAYNSVGCPHGRVIEARGTRRRSGANGNTALNDRSYAVLALLGTDGGLDDTLKTAVADAIDWHRDTGAGRKLWAHCDAIGTECPGPELVAWVHAGGPRPS